MSTEPLFMASRYGFRFTVYTNRIEIDTRRGCLGIPAGGKQQVIPMRNIADVTVESVTKKLHITTNDGRHHSFVIGANADEARTAILSSL